MKKLWQLLPLAGVLLGSCAQQQQKEVAAEAAVQELVVPPAAAHTNVPLGRLWQTHRPMIYQGEMHMQVTDFEATTSRLDTLLYAHGAYLAEAHEATQDGRHTQHLSIRVPSARFVPLTYALGRLGYVESKDITSRDLASEQWQVRTQDTAASVLSAQDKLLAEEATMGTLSLFYYQPIPAEMAPQPPMVPRLVAGLRFGWNLLGEFFVALTYLWPLSLLIAAWLLYRHWRRLAA
ncbi:DUF4349 domain-containing protein [Hymenobacter perfusus]|uniref:DUF4349 domain-containing protein n=1 Tax=Hymenobacter perfusus TaxID=1236770 RepID=A0A3R9NY55_9BACT|nr:DUF4349 domain-containing protein [Hymenobacter perfusus]RSK44484.1 DUF4349 domain-containing protein [Hymenobacter perfusus]